MNFQNFLKKIILLLAAGFLAINTVFLDSLQAKQKKSTGGKLKAYSSKHNVEGAYPYIVAADWLAVHYAYKAVGKLENAKFALEFSNRLEALAKAKEKK